MQWFLKLLDELGIECRVRDAAKIRAAEPRKQKHDRRDVELNYSSAAMQPPRPYLSKTIL
jgi:transposase